MPYNALDFKYSNPEKRVDAKFTDVKRLLDKMNYLYRLNTDNIIEAYPKYKTFYDRKVKAQPLKLNDFVFLLNPKYDSQKCKEEFKTWEGPYTVMKVLSDSNYIIRRVGTHRTQFLHRMRLRQFKPDYQIDDIEVSSDRLYADLERAEEIDIFDSSRRPALSRRNRR